jgi:hypothetical protein
LYWYYSKIVKKGKMGEEKMEIGDGKRDVYKVYDVCCS